MARSVRLPIIPLKEIVIFPSSVTPFFIMRHKSLLALEASLAKDKRVFLVAQKSSAVDLPIARDLYRVGTVADIIQVLRLPDGSAKVLVEGDWVGRVERFDPDTEHLSGLVRKLDFFDDDSRETKALMRTVLSLFENYASLSDKVPQDLAGSIKSLDNALQLCNAIANYAAFRSEDKQRVLEALDVDEKLEILSRLLAADNELLKLENQILSQVKNQIGKSQKDYFLNEQLKVIESELGLGGDEDMELEEFQDRIDKSKMDEPAREKCYRELSRLSRMAPLSPEATVSRTYIEWLLDLPWGKTTRDRLDLDKAQKVLDADHYGLEKVKERIIEHLAVHKLVKDMRGPILCFVGPPGVGKTSLARSIARALKRKFVRFSLGGVRDEAEIRGHRRTYIGSMPGKIIQSMKKSASINPVFLLDEIDKMSADFRGDPASALLEALDPEQNKAFNDHYLEVDFDLSKVMFITTANTTAGIPHALLDRMELIRLPGYTEVDKAHIARNHFLKKQVKAHGLTQRKLPFSDESIKTIIRAYTHEAGVRNLEREIASICRKVARRIVSDAEVKSVKVTPDIVRELLGPVRFHDMELHAVEDVGVAVGLAWTEAGGELLPVETTLMPGKGGLTLTGKLGEVMQESAKAALSYIRAHAGDFGLAGSFYKNLDIHIHVPEGAIPKDGPSAGVTLAISLLSALTKRPVRNDIAMTGELTLHGRVLKIGGLKEKAIAAHRQHLTTVIIPFENVPEIEEISEEVREAMNFAPVRNLEEAIEIAFVQSPLTKKSGSGSKSKGGKGRKRRPATRSRQPGVRA